MRVSDPVFGDHGRKVVVTLCSYEVVALIPQVPLPPITEMVKEWGVVGKVIGVGLLALLGHHFFIEKVMEEIVDEVVASTTAEVL